jgi:Tfp pilus assembly protein PilV
MTKTFYTERDVEDLFRQGIMTITLTDDIVMTDLAYERANKLAMKMVQAEEAPPAAPIRPYINATPATMAAKPASVAPNTNSASRVAEIKAKVRETVKNRMGTSIDAALLDAVIDRVAKDLGLG